MKSFLQKLTALCLTVLIILNAAPVSQISAADSAPTANALFSDVPFDSWAAGTISSAVKYGLMNGMGNGLFGYGRT